MIKFRLALVASHVYSEKSSLNNLTKRLIILQWNGSVITMLLYKKHFKISYRSYIKIKDCNKINKNN